MLHTIAPALPRRGRTDVNNALDQLVGEIGWLTPTQFAGLIVADQIIGHPETDLMPSANPVGLWVVSQLQAEGIPAVAYSWVGPLSVYDEGRWLLGEVRIPEHHTMHQLACEVNDLDRPEITWAGENDPR